MNKLIKAIEKTGISKRKLSVLLGKHHSYLNVVINKGLSKDKLEQLIKDVEAFTPTPQMRHMGYIALGLVFLVVALLVVAL